MSDLMDFNYAVNDEMAKGIVEKYVRAKLDASDGDVTFEVYTVWKCKALKNWK